MFWSLKILLRLKNGQPIDSFMFYLYIELEMWVRDFVLTVYGSTFSLPTIMSNLLTSTLPLFLCLLPS